MLATKLAHLDPEKDPLHDFRNFLYYVFTLPLDFGDPDEIQYDVADWMQNSPPGEDGIRRLQIQAMRGCGKSVIACAYCAWLWYCNPTIRIVVISSVAKKANEFAGLVKQILDKAELLQHLRPDPEADVTMRHGRKIKSLKKSKNTEDAFDISGCGPGKDPSFAAYPVFGGWTGSHPDIIIPDDVEIPENSLTVFKRNRLFEKLRECERLVMEGGVIMYMGTPQTEDSIYDKLDAIGYQIRRWPSELPNCDDEKRTRNVSPWLLARSKVEGAGSPSYPERFPAIRLAEAKAKGLAHYNLQMLLDTTLADHERYPLKLKNLIVFDTPADMGPTNIVWGTAQRMSHIDHGGRDGDDLHAPGFVEPAWAPFQDKTMAIDPKGGGADTVGWAVTATLNGVIYCLDAGGMAKGTSGTADHVMIGLSKIAHTYGVKRVRVESNYAGSKTESAWARLLQPHMAKWNGPTEIILVHVKGQKERRICDILQPLTENHRLVFSEKAARCAELTYQFTHITRDAGALGHEDELDALASAVEPFLAMCVMDPEVRDANEKEAAALAVAKEFDTWAAKNTGPGKAQAAQSRQSRRPARQTRRWSRS
jgi:hypothetical protein